MDALATQRLTHYNWQDVTASLHEKGYALLPGLLTGDECDSLKNNYNNDALYRKTVVMERHRYGLGEYKYFNYPLPGLIEAMRVNLYPRLAPIANTWMQALKIDTQYPALFSEFQRRCHDNNQTKPTALILKYGKGGHNTLHQDLYGDVFFPMQAVLFLSDHGTDYTGGEFILAQQIPRAQSKVISLAPGKGDVLVFTTNFRPQKGAKEYYRVNVKHGVSEVQSGERYTMGIIFHDALS
ncbi:MAG TPA: 2OG-Fe(II) oxygenase [Chitinophagaceae bacterium]|nr:2OG-Fe(II) oxygenase [Chitinophagaceae bacterium]